MKRILLGIALFILFIVAFTFDLFPLLIIAILILGSMELSKILKFKPAIVFAYWLIFVFSMILAIINFKHNAIVLFFGILVIVATDSFAYLIGKLFGKHHFSKISPNKTIEGLLAGVFGSILLMNIIIFILPEVGNFLNNNNLSINYNIVIILISILAIIGDLVESYVKRCVNIKDTSNILGQHGGVLDRIDSWIFVMILISVLYC